MARRFISIHTDLRATLEYAEAKKLLLERHVLKCDLATVDDEIRMVKRISPLAYAMAKKDISGYGGESGYQAPGMEKNEESNAAGPEVDFVSQPWE